MLKKVFIKGFDEEQVFQLNFSAVFQSDSIYDINRFEKEEIFIFHPFIPSNESPIFWGKIESKKIFRPEVKPLNKKFPKEPINTDKTNYTKGLKSLIDQIRIGEYEKVVFSRRLEFDFKINPQDIISVFSELVSYHKKSYCYMVQLSNNDYWMAATPEQLIKSNEFGACEVDSLAGTKTLSNKKNSTWRNKEKEEQLFVTRYIKSELSKLGFDVTQSEVKEVIAGNLLHLQSKLNFNINNSSDLINAIVALHPTPAVCGIPKEKTKNFLKKNESYNRLYYSGFLGTINFQNLNSNLVVNLRCMKIVSNKTFIFAGGGITKDSNPEEEWQETENKSLTLRKILENL